MCLWTLLLKPHTCTHQGGMGYWAVNYTSAPTFLVMSYCSLLVTTLGTLNEFWLVDLLNLVFKHSTTICNLQKGWFCVSSWGMNKNLTTIVLSLYIPVHTYRHRHDTYMYNFSQTTSGLSNNLYVSYKI